MSAAEEFALPGEHALDHQVMVEIDGRLELAGAQCRRCGFTTYPPRELCPRDTSRCDPVVLPRNGTLYAVTRVELAPLGFTAPYWVGWVDLSADVRVFTLVDSVGDRAPRPGDAVALRPRVVRTEPHTVVGPVFVIE